MRRSEDSSTKGDQFEDSLSEEERGLDDEDIIQKGVNLKNVLLMM